MLPATLFFAILAHNKSVQHGDEDDTAAFFIVVAGLTVVLVFNFLVDDYAQHIDRKRRSEGEKGDKTYKPVKM